MTLICTNQQWKCYYGPPKCNYLTGIPLISSIKITDLLQLPYLLFLATRQNSPYSMNTSEYTLCGVRGYSFCSLKLSLWTCVWPYKLDIKFFVKSVCFIMLYVGNFYCAIVSSFRILGHIRT